MINTDKKITFVVVCWNNSDIIIDCLKSLQKQTYKDCETIVIDNNSTDSSVEVVKKDFPDVKLMLMDDNYGFSKANNIAIKQALIDKDCGYIGLINSDARLAPDWAEIMIDFAEKKPNLACAQGINLDYKDDSIIDSTHIFVARNGSGVQGNWRNLYKGELGPKKVFGVNAAAALISRSFIEEQPKQLLFDESYFMYLEDVDVAYRATLSGWDNYLVAGARAWHMGSASTNKRSSSFGFYYTYRNNLGMLVKNTPFSLVPKLLLKAVKGDIDTMRHLKRTDQAGLIPVLLKGRAVSLLRLPVYLLKRKEVKRTISKQYLWNLMIRGY